MTIEEAMRNAMLGQCIPYRKEVKRLLRKYIHGTEWIRENSCFDLFKCGNCGNSSFEASKYCPDCGMRMKEPVMPTPIQMDCTDDGTYIKDIFVTR